MVMEFYIIDCRTRHIILGQYFGADGFLCRVYRHLRGSLYDAGSV
jgi:hypothetical protein